MLRKAMIMILVSIMCVSWFMMAQRDLELKREEEEYARIQEEMAREAVETARYEAQQTTQKEEEDTDSLAKEFEKASAYEAPQALLDTMAAYHDCIGYIDIEDTNIHYPVMQNEDNEYYLHRDADGKDSISGCIYMDSNHDIREKGLHTIYGHHMKNGSMFRDVVKFADPAYMEAHQEITILTADREIRLKPVYCYAGKADGTYRQVLETHGQVVRFIMDHTGMEINTDDLYVLVTCSYGSVDERTYLYCVPDAD